MKFIICSLLILWGLASVSSGFLLKNVGSSECVKDMDEAAEKTRYLMSPCSKQSTQFNLLSGREGSQRISSTWTQKKGQKAKEKCAFAKSSDLESDYVWSIDCDWREYNPKLQWNIKEVDSQLVITHPKDGRCLKAENGVLTVVKNCDETDQSQRWVKQ